MRLPDRRRWCNLQNSSNYRCFVRVSSCFLPSILCLTAQNSIEKRNKNFDYQLRNWKRKRKFNSLRACEWLAKTTNTDHHLSICNCSSAAELEKAANLRISRSAWCTFSRVEKNHLRRWCTKSRANLCAGARLHEGERIRCYTGPWDKGAGKCNFCNITIFQLFFEHLQRGARQKNWMKKFQHSTKLQWFKNPTNCAIWVVGPTSNGNISIPAKRQYPLFLEDRFIQVLILAKWGFLKKNLLLTLVINAWNFPQTLFSSRSLEIATLVDFDRTIFSTRK